MELHNKAQDKKFTASSSSIERRGTVGTFYLQPNRTEKSFADKRDYSSRQYVSHSFNSGSPTTAATQNRSANTTAQIETSAARDVRGVHDANNAIASRDYADGQHQFTERGKSQKSLDRQNPTLTIDQVRELLNKNK